MKIKRITLNNFKLFIEEEIEPRGLNIFIGDNKDNQSSNASGKSTLALESIMFALYGYTTSNLVNTISKGKKEASVEVVLDVKGKEYKILRTIPSKVYITVAGEEKSFATATIAQKFLNNIFGDIDFFRKFRTLDMQRGINLLDLGNTSLKNLLMAFIQDYFTNIRKSLLEKKQYMNSRHIKHKPLCHFYSEKRLGIINKELTKLQEEFNAQGEDPNREAREIYGELSGNNSVINNLTRQLEGFNQSICPTCKREMPKDINDIHIEKIKEELEVLNDRNDELNKYLKQLNEEIALYNNKSKILSRKMHHLEDLKFKLLQVKKLSAYKYTDKDIALYSNAIKILDNFSAIYIDNWLSNLSAVINSLLKELNISIKFNPTKEFMTVQDGTESIRYDQLSTGQKRFLNIVFKLAILMQKNLEGIIVIDEGIDALDIINLKRLIRIFEALPFQVFLISQHSDIQSLKDIKCFHIVRQNNRARVVA